MVPFLSNGWNIILAVLGFAFVIFIHELGHFLFAKWAKVKVERFSIGFGPIVWSKTVGETEYSLSLLPLGGYVKMLGEEDGDEGKNNPRSFPNATAPWRALILLGGVMFNLISSYVILLALAFYGMPLMPPIVGEVDDQILTRDRVSDAVVERPSPGRELGLQQGDYIESINGEIMHSFDDVMYAVMTQGNRPISMSVRRRGRNDPITLPEQGQTVTPVYDVENGRPSLGIDFPRGRRISAVLSQKALSDTDPHPGEYVTGINGQALPKDIVGQEISERLLRFIGRDVTLTLENVEGARRDATISYAGRNRNDGIGFPVRISQVSAGSPAAIAGLKVGDVVMSVDDLDIYSTEQFTAVVRSNGDIDQESRITVQRAGEAMAFRLRAAEMNGKKLIGVGIEPVMFGRLPRLPLGPGNGPGPLAQAGVKVSDVILATKMEEDSLTVTVLSGGEAQAVRLPDQVYEDLRLDALANKGGLLDQLLARQVVAIETKDDALAVKLVDPAQDGSRVTIPAAKAGLKEVLSGLQPGDWICGLVGQSDGGHAFEIVRGADQLPRVLAVKSRQSGIALVLGPDQPPHQLKNWQEAFTLSNSVMHNMVWRTLQLIPRFFTKAAEGGVASSKSLSGPIGIFDALKASYERLGFPSFLKLVAQIGLSLFLVNLLPIPVVDGGQLVFLAIETVIRRPVPVVVKAIANYLGLALVVALMLFVLSLDILRKMGLM
jgi:regulator of sigma E protease